MRWLTALWVAVLLAACDLSNSVAQRPHGPSRVTVGPLVTSAWLPAGLDEFHFSASDRQHLAAAGLTHVEWLQRAERDGRSAETWLMEFVSARGMAMPVYYEPPGYTPYDKLRNWATKTALSDTFDTAVDDRVAALAARWESEPGFGGYLVGHEDYRASSYEALARTVAALRRVDPARPAISVGAIESYPQTSRFLDALFVEGGEPNVFQHEHYVFHADVEPGSARARRRLDDLVEGYDRVARHLQARHGRWHAIVQAHGESRDGQDYYRPPTPAELSVQAGLALSRGASGIVYFLYSSGVENVLNGDGDLVQVRFYDGLVDAEREPTERYDAARQLNGRLAVFGEVLHDRYFLGGYEARRAPADEPVTCDDERTDLGFFGDASATSHVLVVNRHTTDARTVRLSLAAEAVLRDVEGVALRTGPAGVEVDLPPGGFRLLAIDSETPEP
jgi:hypothetical protein